MKRPRPFNRQSTLITASYFDVAVELRDEWIRWHRETNPGVIEDMVAKALLITAAGKRHEYCYECPRAVERPEPVDNFLACPICGAGLFTDRPPEDEPV